MLKKMILKCLLVLISVVTIGLFGTGLHGKMIFDDNRNVVENSDIDHLGAMLSGSSRPLTEFTFYINYALHGADVVPYHVVNILIHTIAALLLFGIVRRTLLLTFFEQRFNDDAPWLAGAVALIWAVHPLHCESVTYIVQRAESMAGMFALLTVYAFLRSSEMSFEQGDECRISDALDRSIEVEGCCRSNRFWEVISVAACALGMLSKPVMVVVPLLVLLFDSVFIAKGVRISLRRRWRLYLLLAMTSLISILLVSLPNESSSSTGFGNGIGAWRYLLTQGDIVWHYLRLSIYPRPLCLDYEWLPLSGLKFLGYTGIILIVMAVVSVVLLLRRRAVGFIGCWLFITLAPSSSFIPVDDLAAERRMYLPLIAVVVLVVFGGYWIVKRCTLHVVARQTLMALIVIVVVVGLGGLTVQRNRLYESEKSMWLNVLESRPDNLRARMALGKWELNNGNILEAKKLFMEVLLKMPLDDILEIIPSRLLTLNSLANVNLGVIYEREGDFVKARNCFREALRVAGKNVEAMVNLGIVLSREADDPESVELWTKALEIEPNHAKAHFCLGWSAMKRGDSALAREHLVPVEKGRGELAQRARGMLDMLNR